MGNRIIRKPLEYLSASALSRIAGAVMDVQLPTPIQAALNITLARIAHLNFKEIEKPLQDYESINALFTRRYKPGLKEFDTNPDLISSPVEGTLRKFGKIENATIFEAKNQAFTLEDLLGTDKYNQKFNGGLYAILYLSPANYHRIHTPCPGKVKEMIYSPGRLFPVNFLGLNNIDNLFPKNERLTSVIDHDGKDVAVVKIGATCVGKISVVYDNFVSNVSKRDGFEQAINDFTLDSGDELGCFHLGSTIILLLEADKYRFVDGLRDNMHINLGTALAVSESRD